VFEYISRLRQLHLAGAVSIDFAFTHSPQVVEFGVLLAYRASLGKLFVRSGHFIKRILDGANAVDLPVEQTTQIELLADRLDFDTKRTSDQRSPMSAFGGKADIASSPRHVRF
jgi:hypothetical protein